MTEVRRAVAADGPILQHIERAAGEQFRTVGLDAIADDEPFTLAELDAYVAAGHSWVALDGAGAGGRVRGRRGGRR